MVLFCRECEDEVYMNAKDIRDISETECPSCGSIGSLCSLKELLCLDCNTSWQGEDGDDCIYCGSDNVDLVY